MMPLVARLARCMRVVIRGKVRECQGLPAENGADIWITAKPEGQAVRIEVADNGNGEGAGIAASPSTGVGLANIRDRLSQAYGGAHRFETKKNDRGGFSVIVEIPFETGDNPS